MGTVISSIFPVFYLLSNILRDQEYLSRFLHSDALKYLIVPLFIFRDIFDYFTPITLTYSLWPT